LDGRIRFALDAVLLVLKIKWLVKWTSKLKQSNKQGRVWPKAKGERSDPESRRWRLTTYPSGCSFTTSAVVLRRVWPSDQLVRDDCLLDGTGAACVVVCPLVWSCVHRRTLTPAQQLLSDEVSLRRARTNPSPVHSVLPLALHSSFLCQDRTGQKKGELASFVSTH
jgi:hypothetical protein